ncbi:hypothetical protein [Runella zeae]|jgi:hypothetical protein|uniref:hypothetical protein n=1 Tax=Runella zeae TaxID=94255 RepID=UPI0004240ADC|nr:hypothetical protein [Runella zeae]
MKSSFKFCFVTIGLIVLLASCKKEDPEPILADQMAGEYKGTYYTVGGTTRVNLPATNTSGVTATSKISVIKISDETATFRITFTLTDKAGKSSDSFSTHESLTLKKSSSGEIEGYQGTTKLASLINGELGVTFPNADPKSIVVFYGKK